MSLPTQSSKSEANGPSSDHSKLFEIVAKGDLLKITDFYTKHGDLTIKDNEGNNLLHIAASNDKRTACRAIAALTVYNQLWEQTNNKGKTPIDVATPRIRKDLQLISMKSAIIADHHTVYNRGLLEERLANPNDNYKVLLSCDGGGIKAILEITLLLAIEHELKEPLLGRIHWMSGTSCGGIITLLLGCGLSLDNARKMFMAGRERTFCGNNKMFPKHDARGLEGLLKEVLGASTTMGDIKTHKMLVTAAKVKSAPPSLVLFRNYAPRITVREYEKYGYLNPDRVLVWKAARSTSAAPVYFDSFHGLADGALFCNNPCITMMTDFLRLKKLENHKGIENKDEIGCIITIGSGVEPLVPLGGIDINLSSPFALGKDFMDVFGKGKNLITLFMYQCTSSHAVPVGQAREWAHSIGVPYFRFSPRLSRAFELDSHQIDGIYDFMFETEVYLRTQARQDIADLVKLLKTMPINNISQYKSTVHS